MNLDAGFKISWNAPVVPGASLAGIPLGVCSNVLMDRLNHYMVDYNNNVCKFHNSPELRLITQGLDAFGNGSYSFFLFDDAVVNKLLKNFPALYIAIREWSVFAIKVYDFSFPGEAAQALRYRGELPSGHGLGDLVSELKKFADLEFDDAEEWFFGSCEYDGLEVTGWGVPLEDRPDQIITALCVLS
ncbi:hypothetical protein [Pseudomonas fulva]|uniref:hypothetical protein n=1 Tax=Pseudomonas fulva TaxID=47880 RepID=UPI003462288B